MLESGTISEIALIFVTGDGFDVQVNRSLALVGSRLGVSRCYLFLDSDDGETTSNTHEWCAEGVEPEIDNLKDIPYASIPSWKAILDRKVVYPVEDVGTLPDDVRGVLEAQGISAIVFAPLLVEGGVRGFLGFDECCGHRAWTSTEIETLRTISGIISTAYAKKLLGDRIAVSEANFRTFFETVDDIILVGDTEGRVVYANEAACRRLGYARGDFVGMPIIELHPADKRDEAARILDAMFRRELDRCPLELGARDGSRVPVETRVWFGQWDGRPAIFGVSKDLSAEQAALQKFERLFHGNPAAMAVSSVPDHRFVDVNEAFLRIFGYERREVIGVRSPELRLFVDGRRWRGAVGELEAGGRVRNRELELRRKDGALIHGLFSGELIETQGRRFLLTVMVDVTETVTLREALEVERKRLANVIEGTRLGTWEWNVRTGETVFDERWAEMLGYSLAELSPTSIGTWEALAHPDDLAESDRLLAEHFEGRAPYYEHESRMRHRDGSWVWVLDRGRVVERDAEGRPLKMYGTHSDITEKKLMEERIRELAVRDPLTGAYNRRHLFERLEAIGAEYVRRERNFCVSILDIDRFKAINDTFGHQAGDLVLRNFAALLASSIRPYELLGRYGGEEFLIVSPSARKGEVIVMLERMMGAARALALDFEGRAIRMTFSGGVADSAEFESEGFSVEAMVALADRRLYAAKASGRDRCLAD
ncbi:MAG: PAS domain S-box protein [Spirochaetia bacterium]|nr:PAS domain S-box protein [Spirochaetia bacterium]